MDGLIGFGTNNFKRAPRLLEYAFIFKRILCDCSLSEIKESFFEYFFTESISGEKVVLFTNISSKSTCLFIEPQAGHLMFVQNEGFASRIVRLPLTQVWISWAKLFSID